MMEITWKLPRYRQEKIDIPTPYEEHLDLLIMSSKSKRMAAFLQCTKETYADPGELLRLKWSDVDFKNCKIHISEPVKNHSPRELDVSTKLLSMLSMLPKKGLKIFNVTYGSILGCFTSLREYVAKLHNEPEILKIKFTSFRHWGATKLAYEWNGNGFIIKDALGHAHLSSTEKYVGKIRHIPKTTIMKLQPLQP
jgi:integrase